MKTLSPGQIEMLNTLLPGPERLGDTLAAILADLYAQIAALQGE